MSGCSARVRFIYHIQNGTQAMHSGYVPCSTGIGHRTCSSGGTFCIARCKSKYIASRMPLSAVWNGILYLRKYVAPDTNTAAAAPKCTKMKMRNTQISVQVCDTNAWLQYCLGRHSRKWRKRIRFSSTCVSAKNVPGSFISR